MVIIQLKGGLGNQLFQYALGRYLSLKSHSELLFDCSLLLNRHPVNNFTFRDFDLDLFEISGRIAQSNEISLYPKNVSIRSIWYNARHILNIIKQGYRYVHERGFKFDKRVLSLQNKNLYLSGYWQSYRYFDQIESIIRKDLTFRNSLPTECNSTFVHIASVNAICVHIRRTDFLSVAKHGVVSQEYLNEAVRHITEQIEAPHFFIFSDDIAWCRANIFWEYPTTFVDEVIAGPKAQGHLQLMIACRHFIIANSTFSWWAAWLSTTDSGKIVIAPKQWFQNGTPDDDLIPPTWKRL